MDRPGDREAPIPTDWDRLERDAANHDTPPASATTDLGGGTVAPLDDRSPRPPEPVDTITLLAAGWAETATVLAVCTGCLGALLLVGGSPGLRLLPWALAAAVAWWLFAASVLVTVRGGPPGLLLAGLALSRPIRPGRVGWVVAAAGLGGLSLGVLNAVGGPRRNLAAIVSGSSITSRDLDGSAREP